MLVNDEQINEMNALAKSAAEQENENRIQLRKIATQTLWNNQECYVAQWILQNPFLNPADYALKFTYNDQELSGYSVTMEKVNNV